MQECLRYSERNHQNQHHTLVFAVVVAASRGYPTTTHKIIVLAILLFSHQLLSWSSPRLDLCYMLHAGFTQSVASISLPHPD